MTAQQTWVAPEQGAEVPALVRTIELTDMVAYAGATWDWHRLHYDPAYLAEKQLAAPVVDGQVFGALLAEVLLDWLGPEAFLRSAGFPFQGLGVRRRDGALRRDRHRRRR